VAEAATARQACPPGPASQGRQPSASRSDGLRAAMTAELASDQGKAR
jgi:hypothetical protein